LRDLDGDAAFFSSYFGAAAGSLYENPRVLVATGEFE
jgi:hypothetical protein